MTFLVVALAAAVGAPTRYLVDSWVQKRLDRVFPWGTLTVNISGSFLLGLVTGLALYHGFAATPKLLIGTGFCGAYTTFSTFAVETVRLGEDGSTAEAFGNVVTSTVAALLAAAAGLALAAAL
jgi:fluoride exporter